MVEQISTHDIKAKEERNSAFEILRIIAIIFIIAHHFSIHGGFDFSGLENSSLILANKTWISFITQLGGVGVNLFVLISAFFLADNNKFKVKKILYILIEMIVFSLIISVIFLILNKASFSLAVIKSIAFPFGSSTWWFMTSYILLYILSPFLNLGIKAMSKKMHFIFMILFIVIWSFLPTFLSLQYGFSKFGWFLTLHLIAAYFKKYNVSIKIKPLLGILLSAGIFVFWFLISFGFNLLFNSGNYLVWFDLKDLNNFVQVSATLILFLSFKNLHIKSNNAINVIASTTLAIYLFHDHSNVRDFLWITLFKNNTYSTSPVLIPYSLGVILGVFAIGVAIGLFYKYTIGLGINRLLGFLDKRILFKIDNTFNRNKMD